MPMLNDRARPAPAAGVTNYPDKLRALEVLKKLLRLPQVRESLDGQADARRLALLAEGIENDLADLDRRRKGVTPGPIRN